MDCSPASTIHSIHKQNLIPYSVLMAVYHKDHPDWFDMAIDSMIHQTAVPDEILIMQDGPLTDELYAVLKRYTAQYPHLIRTIASEQNRGLGETLQQGVQECKNEWIARMDADDVSDAHRCEKQLQKACEVGADIIGCDCNEFIEDVTVTESRRIYPETHEELMRYARRRSPFCHPAIMMKKSAVLHAGNYQKAFLHEDYNLFIRMLSAGAKAYTVKEELFHFRVNKDMYKRRGGLRYVYALVKFNYALLKRKWMSPMDFIMRSGGNILFGLAPAECRKWLYRRILRK